MLDTAGARERHPIRTMLRVLLALTVAVVAWGVAIEPRLLDVERHTAAVPGLPAAWEGHKVAVLADTQFGMWLGNESTARAAVARIVDERPSVALIAGDLVYGEGDLAEKTDRAVELLAELPRRGIPTALVLGNHDHASGAADQLAQRLRDAGVHVLENESIAVAAPDGSGPPLHVAGIGSWIPGRSRPQAAVGAIPAGAPRLVLMHNPRSFPELPPGSAPVAVAGHTHGGQMRLPFLPEWSYLALVQDDPLPADGWATEDYGAAGNRLYVNRGIGMSLLPLRLNCPPELTLFTLTAS